MVAVPKQPVPGDWLAASAQELKQGDRATLKLLQESAKHVAQILKGLPQDESAAPGDLIYRAQLERVRRELLTEQSKLFDRIGDAAGARRLRSAARAAKLSKQSEAAYLALVGRGEDGKKLLAGADVTSQRTVEAMLARIGLSKVPLAERIYKTSVWMNGRLDRLITQTMATGLNAKRFAKVARDWFSPSVPGGTRYAAYRLARTEINNAFHASTISYAASKPWVKEMEWHLSKSHPKPDICNEVAAESPYPVRETPRKPHPQCMCYVTERELDDDDWIDRYVAGDYDDYLDREMAMLDAPDVDNQTQSASGAPVQVDQPKQQTAPQILPTAVAPKELEPVPDKPSFDQRGYRPASWKQDLDNEAEIQTMIESVLTLVPAAKQAENEAKDGPDWARKFAEKLVSGTETSGEVKYSNGPHRLRFAGDYAKDKEAQARFLADFDFMQSNFPTGHDMHISVAPSSQFQYGVGGETTISTGSMFINERYLDKEKVWAGMPVSRTSGITAAQYILAHEWGHSLSTKDEADEAHTHNHAIEAGGMTPYGTKDHNGHLTPREGYAEAFAEWALSRGKTTNPAALVYAERFNWGERFGID